MIPLRKISATREIVALRRSGRPVRGRNVLVWRSCNEPDDVTPAVCVVLGRGFESSVARNRAKRRLRGCIIDVREMFQPGCAYLVEGRPGVGKVDYQLLVSDLRDVLSRTGNDTE